MRLTTFLKQSLGDEDKRRKKGKRVALLDLDDHCLNAIFEYVSIIDLCSISETSAHLKTVGCQVFDRKFKICCFNKRTAKTTTEARKLFRIFGALISELDIDFYLCPKAAEIMDAVMKYCTTLDCLKLQSYNIPDNQETISSMGKFFQNLKSLHIISLNIEGFDDQSVFCDKNLITPNGNAMDLFVDCNSLTHLKVDDSEHLNRIIFESAFHQLQYFDYFGVCIYFPIDGFIYRHKNLKSILINPYEGDNDDQLPALKVIAATCKKLEKLALSLGSSRLHAEYEESLKKLTRMPLRELKIDMIGEHGNMFARILPSFRDTLEVLDISDAEHSFGIIPAISELRKLRFLRLDECAVRSGLAPLGELTELVQLFIVQIELVVKFDLVRLVDSLINLRKLQVHIADFEIGNQTYSQLVDAVEKRSNVEKRNLQIDCPTTEEIVNLQVAKVNITPFEHHQVRLCLSLIKMSFVL